MNNPPSQTDDKYFPSSVDSGGTVVLVSQDGIQRPPFRFPKGGHLLQFLTCLETGLLPHGQLDPPLWSQRGKVGIENNKSLHQIEARKVLQLFLYNVCNLYNFTGKGVPKITEKKSTQLLRVIFWQGWGWSNRLCVSDNISRQSGVRYVAESNGMCEIVQWSYAVLSLWTFVVTYLLFLHLVYTFHPILCTSFLFL